MPRPGWAGFARGGAISRRMGGHGADHILVGTDYPADMGEIDPVGFIEGAKGLVDAERTAILGCNAAGLLNLPPGALR